MTESREGIWNDILVLLRGLGAEDQIAGVDSGEQSGGGRHRAEPGVIMAEADSNLEHGADV
jgi:hypothetical protein